MSAATLSADGLQATDSPTASDHDPHVGDFSLNSAGTPVPDLNAAPRFGRLLPNAPNPFNPSTDLRFALDRPGRVELAVFDARGREVRRFPAAEYAAGEHAVAWDGTDDVPGARSRRASTRCG